MQLFRKHPYLNLNMGLVKENFIIIKKTDQKLWEERGFQKIRKYPIFRYKPNPAEVIMLGRPMTISEFSAENLIHSEILDYTLYLGSYGMGGAGFFGLKLKGSFGIRRLVYCIWSSGEHILLDDKIIECHPQFIEIYHPWIVWGNGMHEEYEKTSRNLKNFLSGLEIQEISLQEHALKIQLSGNHRIETYQKSEKFPEQAGTGRKRLSYETGTMSDYWLVIYDETDLHV